MVAVRAAWLSRLVLAERCRLARHLSSVAETSPRSHTAALHQIGYSSLYRGRNVLRSRHLDNFEVLRWGVAVALATTGLGLVSTSRCDTSRTASVIEQKSHANTANLIVEEPNTHAWFPLYLPSKEQLVAAGVRLMTPLKVQVYALGLYVDPTTAAILLAPWKRCNSSELLNTDVFWEQLTSPFIDMRRALRFEIARDVSGKHMQHGFDRGLIPRVRYAAKEMDLPGGKDALRKFNAAFKNAGLLKVGKQVLISFEGQGKLVLEIEGQARVELDNRALVWAILDMFLGSNPVAPNVKANFAAGFASLLET